MPQRNCAFKALRITKRRRGHNLDLKTDLRKTVKKFLALIAEKKTPEAKAMLVTIYKKFDKAAKNHILAKNTAARRKSRFARLIQATG